MSVINQVLNELERRGAHNAAEQPMVRAVQRNRNNFITPLLAVGLVLIAGVAAWQWESSRKPAVVTGSVASKAGNAPGSYEAENLAPVPLPFSLLEVSGPATSTRPLVQSEAEGSGQAASTGSGHALMGEKNNQVANAVTVARLGEGAPKSTTVRPQTVPVVTAKAKAGVRASDGVVPMKQVSTAQQADAEFRRAAGLMQLGHIAEATAGYEAALRLDAGHDAARQALVALLLERKRNGEAEKVLLEGLNSQPENTGLTMLLARLQVERGALREATATLEKSLPFADEQADYRAFLAALLQRQNRNEEAIAHYQIVLQHAPVNGIWLMGYGISLQAVQRNAEAKDAYKRALDTQMLSPELQAFVQQKLKGL